jgi:hypothetical protein
MKNARMILIVSALVSLAAMAFAIFMILSETGVDLGNTSLSELLSDEDTQGLIIIPVIVLISLLVMIPFFRVFFPLRIKNGVKSRSRVLEVHDTGVTINDNPQVRVKLELRTREGTQMEVEAKTIVSRLNVANVQPGVFANVIYDPLKPQRVLIESFETLEQPEAINEVRDERPPSATERLLELSDLRARGLVTEEEYQAKRSEILEDL